MSTNISYFENCIRLRLFLKKTLNGIVLDAKEYFTMPKEYFCDVCSFSFSLLLLKMSFESLININQQSKEETLVCAIWWCKADIDKDIPKQFYTKITVNGFIWVKLQALANYSSEQYTVLQVFVLVLEHKFRTTTSKKISQRYNDMELYNSTCCFYKVFSKF